MSTAVRDASINVTAIIFFIVLFVWAISTFFAIGFAAYYINQTAISRCYTQQHLSVISVTPK